MQACARSRAVRMHASAAGQSPPGASTADMPSEVGANLCATRTRTARTARSVRQPPSPPEARCAPARDVGAAREPEALGRAPSAAQRLRRGEGDALSQADRVRSRGRTGRGRARIVPLSAR